MSVLFFTILFLLLGSAFCSGSEAAILSLTTSKIKSLSKDKPKKSSQLLGLKENITSTIASIVLLNNLFNIPGTFLVGVVAKEVLVDDWKLGIFTIFFTIAIIIFGEILPKNFGERFAVNYSFFVVGLLVIISKVLFPLLWLLEKLNVLLFGKRNKNSVSEDEIKALLDLGIESNSIEYDEHNLIKNVFNMNDKTAQDIMTPRVNIYSISENKSLKSQKKLLINSPHSRIPLYKEDHDDIQNYIFLRDALEALSNGDDDQKPNAIAIPILKIKANTKVDSLLLMFQKRREHMALVIDEFGGTSGIVTLEDVLEELVGEIVDETDKVVDMRFVQTN